MRTENENIFEDLGNNESRAAGVFAQNDGTWLAMTFSKSRTFKTERGAWAWYAKQMRGTKKTYIECMYYKSAQA